MCYFFNFFLQMYATIQLIAHRTPHRCKRFTSVASTEVCSLQDAAAQLHQKRFIVVLEIATIKSSVRFWLLIFRDFAAVKQLCSITIISTTKSSKAFFVIFVKSMAHMFECFQKWSEKNIF